jgi:hypothetical protein
VPDDVWASPEMPPVPLFMHRGVSSMRADRSENMYCSASTLFAAAERPPDRSLLGTQYVSTRQAGVPLDHQID